jgi:prophage regulatory protein
MSKKVNPTDSAEAARIRNADFWDADDLHAITGTPASTWRYWAINGKGPPSFRLGKRRVWRRLLAESWLAEQERAAQQ